MIAWSLHLLPPGGWDALRNWLATIGALVALLIAANTYRRNIRIKREEQARLVYSKVTHVVMHQPGDTFPLLPNGAQMGNGSEGVQIQIVRDRERKQSQGLALAGLLQVTVIIHNGSKELIGPARVQMMSGVTGKVWDEFYVGVAEVEPETNFVADFTWINDLHPGMPPLATTLIFRDSSSQWWRRRRSDPIEKVHDDPENTGPSAMERAMIRRRQDAQGIPQEKWIGEPLISFAVRWHRFWRKRRGKTALP